MFLYVGYVGEPINYISQRLSFVIFLIFELILSRIGLLTFQSSLFTGFKITQELNIDNRTEQIEKQQAFITLKDHKDNFANHPTCRLVNPAKSELGKVSIALRKRAFIGLLLSQSALGLGNLSYV